MVEIELGSIKNMNSHHKKKLLLSPEQPAVSFNFTTMCLLAFVMYIWLCQTELGKQCNSSSGPLALGLTWFKTRSAVSGSLGAKGLIPALTTGCIGKWLFFVVLTLKICEKEGPTTLYFFFIWGGIKPLGCYAL